MLVYSNIEFIGLFNEWASTYDQTVSGGDPEYVEVFDRYKDILRSVAEWSRGTVVEFGVGTGNLTAMLLEQGLTVYGVEPSEEMRRIASKRLPDVEVMDGDFLNFALPIACTDTIVSTYAFHHLTDVEKESALRDYHRLLSADGRIIFADTLFIDEEAKIRAIQKAKQNGYTHLAKDLATEYYTTLPVITEIFRNSGFDVECSQMNRFVWLMKAVKTKHVEPYGNDRLQQKSSAEE